MTDVERAAEPRELPDTNAEPLSVITHSIHTFISANHATAFQERAGGLATLVRKDLHVGKTRRVVCADTDELEPCFWEPKRSPANESSVYISRR